MWRIEFQANDFTLAWLCPSFKDAANTAINQLNKLGDRIRLVEYKNLTYEVLNTKTGERIGTLKLTSLDRQKVVERKNEAQLAL